MNDTPLTRAARLTSWACQLLAAAILAQTLYFKFSGAEESRFIFESLGAEPAGRIASGVMELVSVVLLLAPRTAVLGALLAAGTMAGALVTHAFVIGIEVQGDGGLLFALAVLVLSASVVVLVLRRFELPVLGRVLAARSAT